MSNLLRRRTLLGGIKIPVEYLVIAGGGSGGSNAVGAGRGGGGAGGYRSSVIGESSGGGAPAEPVAIINKNNPFTVTVGAGGAPQTGNDPGNRGSDSVFGSVVSVGGGIISTILPGSGNGGTGIQGIAFPPQPGTPNQGFSGGNAFGGSVNGYGGGGGSAAQVGNNATSTVPGTGANGLASSITGSSIVRAGGGGGTSSRSENRTTAGGSGGGTAGINSTSVATSASGGINTGGGSGAAVSPSGATSGAGGSGVVICRLPEGYVFDTIGAGLTYNYTVVSDKPVYTFTAGTDNVSVDRGYLFEYLVVAGGGSGWLGGGGGGAGGYRSSVIGENSGRGSSAESPTALSKGSSFVVTVGAGGSFSNGSNSVFSSIASTGGGRGGPYQQAGNLGGSGGGAGRDTVNNTGAGPGTAGQGYDGGPGCGTGWAGAGGGGGAGQAGQKGVSTGAQSGERGGAGGNGISSSITGSAVARAGGGGGYNQGNSINAPGGSGGGGTGGASFPPVGATSGVANTGGGGGGSGTNETVGSGGSGIVILKYPASLTLTVGAGLTSSTTTSGEFKITQFTAGTDTVTVG